MSEIIKLNDRDFIFDCTFINGTPQVTSTGKNTIPVQPISYSSIEFLEIVDNIFNPFLQIRMGIRTPYNFTEKMPGDNAFRFNPNSRNFCYISLVPKDIKDVGINEKLLDGSRITFTGIINDSKVISTDDTGSTTITILDIIDSKEASLKEQKVGFVYEKIDTSITVAENIKNLLLKIHPNDSVIGPEFNLGSQGGIKINQSYIFPLQYTLLDAIQFLLPFNIATVNSLPSQLILRYDSATQTYYNSSLFDLFNKADQDDINLETFILGSQQPNNSGEAAPQLPNNNVTTTLKDNMINNISFSNVTFNVSNKDLLPIFCASTTNPTNINSLSFISLKEQLEEFEKKVLRTGPMLKIYGRGGGGDNIVVNVDLDPSKVGRDNYKLITTPFDDTVNVPMAKAQMYNSFIFENMVLSFRTTGQPYRSPGHFINVARTGNTGGSFDERMLGQWIVTEVIHSFTGGAYNNSIQGVKPYRIET